MKKRKLLVASLICLLVSSLILAGCTEETTPTPTSTPAASAPTQAVQANWWDKFGEPKYGGTITLRVNELSTMQFDTLAAPVMSGQWWLYYDNLFISDWTVDREEWSFKLGYIPTEYMAGSLVESWEMPDGETAVLHLRQGVYFQDKEPVNGRELMADDVVYHYNRMMGTGNGFTAPSPYFSTFAQNYFQSASADDDYTVTIKFKTPSALNLDYLMTPGTLTVVEAPEWVALGGPPTGPEEGSGEGGLPPPPGGDSAPSATGPLDDWRNAVGTGPWLLSEFVEGSSLNFVRNPDYWGYDERYPENQLPYADELTVLCIPDATTALAALRTGQIDVLSNIEWQQADTLAGSNPELLQSHIPTSCGGLIMNLNNEPFTDINVRKALQLAIDVETIVATHFGGTVDATPSGMVHPIFTEYAYTYDEWPQELKDEYSYNPEKAKQLLADAGYPGGLNISCVTAQQQDLQLLQILQSMFSDVGVNLESIVMDQAAYVQLIMQGSHEHLAGPTPHGWGSTGMPWAAVQAYSTIFRNPSTVNDPVYDDMYRAILASTDRSTLAQKVKDTERYALEHHWGLLVSPQKATFNIYQPYLKGYSGESTVNMNCDMSYYARWWIDQGE